MMLQRGRNNKYPKKIETWKIGDDVPEWLSDRAKVELVDLGSGKKTIKTNEFTNGGIEVVAADGRNSLVKTTSKTDLICFGDGKIFSLTEKQLNLLYKNEETKRGI